MYIMKKNILMLSALFLSITAMAQTDVTTGVMRGKDYGVTYMLPKTEIEIVLQATKHTYTPGEFCRYADRYLRLNNVSAEPEEFWTLDKIETRIAGVPDKDNVYFVKMKDKTVAPLMELTEDGIVRSINIPFSGKPAAKTPEAKATESSIDPRSFLTEEILMSNSSAKMAELVAKEIYSIRESKNALLRGEADNMPKDGAQLKLMLDNLNQQETAMTEMFSGICTKTSGGLCGFRLPEAGFPESWEWWPIMTLPVNRIISASPTSKVPMYLPPRKAKRKWTV